MSTHPNDEAGVCGPVHFFMNRDRKESTDRTLTGQQLKDIAGVPGSDELFLETHCGDELVPNDATILVRNGDRFHTMPSPQYGDGLSAVARAQVDEVFGIYPGDIAVQPDGSADVVLHYFALPAGYSEQSVDLRIQLPPLFPESRPDMFWVSPPITLANGGQPQSTSVEMIGERSWQRFSWHLVPTAWHPGVSRLRDYVRAVLARLHRCG